MPLSVMMMINYLRAGIKIDLVRATSNSNGNSNISDHTASSAESDGK